jgi:alpha-amylase
VTDIVFIFEVHQPTRFRKDFFWAGRSFRRVRQPALFEHYFDREADRAIFDRVSRKCYLPANQILLSVIEEHRRDARPVKVAFSVSGVFLEQCEALNRDVLESFRQLAQSGAVEFLGQTYYHSLAGLYPDRTEFAEQVRLHREALRSFLGQAPRVFENTELLYNNAIARAVEELGFEGLCAEGADRVLAARSPNHLYRPLGTERLRLLLRNYRLTDDIGFRFSARWWSEWPLTAEKYASWLAAAPGDCVCIFPDYETFGEHHWPETGIHEFLRHLPGAILAHPHLMLASPSDVLAKHTPVGELDVPELGGTVSWADLERTTSSWLGNSLQWAYYARVRDLGPLVGETGDPEFLRLWRHFQISDHLYYMFTGAGGPGEVHSYFSPYGSPSDAFVTCQASLADLEARVRAYAVTPDEPFRFHRRAGDAGYTGIEARSLAGFGAAIQRAPSEAITFHAARGDFGNWAATSFHDSRLAGALRIAERAKGSPTTLRGRLLQVVKQRLRAVHAELRDLGYL